MHWAAALFAATIWMLAASFWQLYRPLADDIDHRAVALRIFQDVAPAILLGVLIGSAL